MTLMMSIYSSSFGGFMIKKFFICGFILSFLVNCSDNDGLSEDADQDNFINIAGARIALNSQTPRDWNGQVIDPIYQS